jgi:hypothetical protein
MDFAGGTEIVETGHACERRTITPDANTGTGSWTEQRFIEVQGLRDRDQRRSPIRARAEHADADDHVCAGLARKEEPGAIFAYLRRSTPVTNRVESFRIQMNVV